MNLSLRIFVNPGPGKDLSLNLEKKIKINLKKKIHLYTSPLGVMAIEHMPYRLSPIYVLQGT